ncbi:peptidyl-tRNA hydrolase [Thermoplasmatales archaeon SG8-52-1]|jgi:PTH2 family peptidyl-tRNA hydrolase|nr:MAG: peptidyl-tRNA hydrolase [Thermoplasmatales archaeon SG8-52-1]
MEFDYKMVIVTRKNLELSAGKLAVQVAHAAVLCSFDTKKKNSKWFNKWQNEGAKKAVLKVENEQDFYNLKEKAENLKIVSHIITDAGFTEIPAGTKTVIGIGPAPSNLIDQITGHLQLL